MGPGPGGSARTARFGLGAPVDLLTAISGLGGAVAPRISRAEALQVPAVARARNMIAGTLATLPVAAFGTDRRPVRSRLLEQIDPDVPNAVTLAAIFEDLFFEGISWLKISESGPGDFPTKANHMPPSSVQIVPAGTSRPVDWISPDQQEPANGRVYVDGIEVPQSQLIRFDSPNPPFLVVAARAIRAALQLDQTAAQYANDPLPLGYFSPADGAMEGDDDEITEVLNTWEAARRQRSWGYVGSALKANTLQWNPEQLQLAAARQHAVLEIARHAGIDPEDLGVSTTSRTYQNGEQRRQALLDFTLGAYVSAFQDRLSMGDVTPRGQYVRMQFAGFLRSDTLARMQAYQIGKPLGAYTTEEIRELEDKPPLTAADLAALTADIAPAAMAAPTSGAPMSLVPDLPAVNFSGDEGPAIFVTAVDDDMTASFKVDRESRTITGLAIPWDHVATDMNSRARWTFPAGSLHWSASQPSRVKLDMDHDHGQTVGRAASLVSTSAGLMTSFKVARGVEGDRALTLAEDGVYDGFSIEAYFEDGDEWVTDPEDPSLRRVVSARLGRVTLTPTPAFDDARVTSVAASHNTGGIRMTGTGTTTKTPGAASTEPKDGATQSDMAAFAALVEQMAEQNREALTQMGETFAESFRAALQVMDDPTGDNGRESVRAARWEVTREAPVYSLNGAGHSMVRDAWYAGREKEPDAIERLRKYRSQTEEVAKLAAIQVANASFATSTTGTSGQIIPPGYRPDLFVPQLQQGRPLVGMCSQGTIANATPFTVPVFTSITTGSADHVEGTNPTDGTLTFGTKTVSPGGISGRMVLTREIVDSSNPAIDQIAMAAMRESYARQTESKVYTLLNGANGAGGTITTGFVPSGAQASTYVGTTGTPPAAIAGIRKELARYPFNRFAFPTGAALGQNAAQIVAGAVDSTGRPLFPWVSLGGPMNAAGVGGPGGWQVDNVILVPAWAMTGTAAGDSQIFILNQSDAWVWESPTLSFRFEEKSGPALIELALFGYFGTHLLRPVGLSGIRLT